MPAWRPSLLGSAPVSRPSDRASLPNCAKSITGGSLQLGMRSRARDHFGHDPACDGQYRRLGGWRHRGRNQRPVLRYALRIAHPSAPADCIHHYGHLRIQTSSIDTRPLLFHRNVSFRGQSFLRRQYRCRIIGSARPEPHADWPCHTQRVLGAIYPEWLTWLDLVRGRQTQPRGTVARGSSCLPTHIRRPF